MMNELFTFYLLGLLSVSNLIVIWKFTNISVHFINFWFFLTRQKDKEIYTLEDFEKHMCIYWGWLGELLICPLCLSTHLSWIISLIIVFINDLTLFFIPSCMFTWPLFSYIFYYIFSFKKN